MDNLGDERTLRKRWCIWPSCMVRSSSAGFFFLKKKKQSLSPSLVCMSINVLFGDGGGPDLVIFIFSLALPATPWPWRWFYYLCISSHLISANNMIAFFIGS
ncbi:hypothetical protein Dimus_009309 [Dionaea muscipula]